MRSERGFGVSLRRPPQWLTPSRPISRSSRSCPPSRCSEHSSSRSPVVTLGIVNLARIRLGVSTGPGPLLRRMPGGWPLPATV